MVNIQETIKKYQDLVESLYAETRNLTPEEQTKRSELRKEIDALDFQELKNLGELTIQEKSALLTAKAQLETEKKDLVQKVADLEQALSQKEKEIGAKITSELIAKIGEIAGKNFELKRVPKKDADGKEVKDKDGNTIYEEIVDLSKLESALEEIKKQKSESKAVISESDRKELAKEIQKETPTNYWSIGAAVFAGLAAVLSGFFLIQKMGEKKQANN